MERIIREKESEGNKINKNRKKSRGHVYVDLENFDT